MKYVYSNKWRTEAMTHIPQMVSYTEVNDTRL